MAGGSGLDVVRERVSNIEQALGEIPAEWDRPLVTEVEDLEETMRLLQTRLDEVEAELSSRLSNAENDVRLLKMAESTVAEPSRRMKVPESKTFEGERDAKALENFIWDMAQYFNAARILDREKVMLTTMYLTKDAKLWWRTRLDDDEGVGRPKIETWKSLKKEFKDQFLPCNTSWLVRESLKKLKHTGMVRGYVKEFSSLMLDIRNMSDEDKLFNFLSGLQTWAQLDLRRQGVKDLPSAMAAADGLVDFHINKPSEGAEAAKPPSDEANLPIGMEDRNS